MNDVARRKLVMARSAVVQGYPFFGSLLLRQTLVECETLPDGQPNKTMATDGRNLYYNPQYVTDTRADELQFVCAHEACHPGFLHHTRRNGRDPQLWNQAADYAINPILKRAGMAMPENALYKPRFDGMAAEPIYDIIFSEQQEEQKQQGQGQGQGQGITDQPGAVLDAPAETAQELRQEEAAWEVAVTQAAAFAPAGALPGGVSQLIKGMLDPQVHWSQELQEYMQALAKQDFSWARQNRRFVANGLYLPTLHSEAMPPILFVVDASGSMPGDLLEQACSEMQVILDDLKPEFVEVVSHNTSVTEIGRFEPGDEFEPEVSAGGGTRFAPVCDWIADSDEQYAAVVWFTDLETSDWARCEMPEAPVVWVDFNGSLEPSFGDKHIVMEKS